MKSHFESKYFSEIDEGVNEANYFTPVLKEISGILDFRKLKALDVGCGTGIFMQDLILKYGCNQFYGIDGPSDFHDRAKNRGYKEVFIIADLCSSPLPFEDKSFDFIVSKDVFEHLISPKYVAQEINRVLKMNGLFLFHVPNHFPMKGRLKFLFNNNIDTFDFFLKESRWTFPHIRFYEYEDLISTFSHCGFSLRANLSFHFPVIPIISKYQIFKPMVRALIKKFPNQFSGGYTLLLEKIKDNE